MPLPTENIQDSHSNEGTSGAYKKNVGALITLISIFFFWGFVAASNDILINVFKK